MPLEGVPPVPAFAKVLLDAAELPWQVELTLGLSGVAVGSAAVRERSTSGVLTSTTPSN